MTRIKDVMIMLLLSIIAGATMAGATVADADQAGGDSAPQQIVETLKQTYPKLDFQRVYISPVAGLYEVVSGNRILYFSADTGHMLVGDLWNQKGVNLSKARIGKIMGEKLNDLPMDKAVKIGSGKNIVIEVTDPDCPYCRKASDFFSKRTDVTRYVFFLPLKMHPNAESKVRYILSSENQMHAYEDVMSGRYDDIPLPEYTDNGVFEIHKAATDLLGLTGTPNFWINGTYLSGANLKAIEKLLN